MITDSIGISSGRADGGIERIPGEQPVPGGPTIISSDWGSWRARLQPRPGTNTFGRDFLYIHNSHKGYTSGCIETCDELLDELIRNRNAGVSQIDVVIRYTDHSTHGSSEK